MKLQFLIGLFNPAVKHEVEIFRVLNVMNFSLLCLLYIQIHFVIVSDDIKMARQIFPFELHSFATFVPAGHSAIEDLAILSLCCEHSLISVGSYGWWASFLRERRRLTGAGWTGTRLQALENMTSNEVLINKCAYIR